MKYDVKKRDSESTNIMSDINKTKKILIQILT